MTPQVGVLAADTGGVNGVALAVLVVLFLLVTVAGFMASRFKRADSLESLDEWGLGGRSFGTWITWFLLGGEHCPLRRHRSSPTLCVVFPRAERVSR